MKNLKIGDSKDAIKKTRPLFPSTALTEENLEKGPSPWRVIHLPYPRETAEYSCLGVRWVECGKIKLPKIFIQKKSLEKQGPSVNYHLLCEQLESILNREEAEGYELVSVHSTHSGSYSVTTTQKQPHHQFLKTRAPSHHLQGKEALILIFKSLS